VYLISREDKKFIRSPLSHEEIIIAGRLHQHLHLNALRSIVAGRLLNEIKQHKLLLVCSCRYDGVGPAGQTVPEKNCTRGAPSGLSAKKTVHPGMLTT
jgi:hypothetical protein